MLYTLLTITICFMNPPVCQVYAPKEVREFETREARGKAGAELRDAILAALAPPPGTRWASRIDCGGPPELGA